ncbi:MAG TPA: alpha/beta fold hydrolase [Vicinamibacterales bacterium]|nr:alpha/beta fold hydrolase [Vicinamibacterales bacterium]
MHSVFLSPFTIQGPGVSIPAEEGLLFVPENRAKANSRTIAIEFIRIRGTRGTGSPIFFLPGGPGGFVTRANISPDYLREIQFLRASGRDILFVNQRGNPDQPLAPDMRWPSSPKPLDQPATQERDRIARRAVVERTQAEWTRRGVDLSGYDIINIADDVEDLRQALGYDRIILRAGSFGSQWSFAFLRRHQASVDRVLLRGIEPLDYGYDSPQNLWRAITRLASEADADSRLKGAIPEGGLLQAAKTVLDRLDRAPRTVTITNPRTGKPVAVTVGKYDLQKILKAPTAGSRRENLERWPRFILELYKGDYRYLAARTFQSRTSTGGKAMIGLLIDNSLGISPAREARLKAQTEQQWVGPLEPGYFATRDLTATHHVPESFLADFRIAPPVVLFEGDMDLSTPMENAVHQSRVLDHGHLTIVHGGTHAVDHEVEQMLPDFTAALQRYLAADTDAEIDAAMKALPAQVALPPLSFETMDGPSLYDQWLHKR